VRPRDTAIVTALTGLVPLCMLQLESMSPDRRDAVRETWAHEATDIIAESADALTESRDHKASAKVLTAMARGLAAGAYAPGGVTFAGHHWQAARA